VIVLDKQGNLAVGSSTGGTKGKIIGRVGSSCVVGAGLYANNKQCAITCTGVGEEFLRHVSSHVVYALMEYAGLSLHDAMKRVLTNMPKQSGGMIGVDRYGNISAQSNTTRMSFGYIRSKSDMYVGYLKKR
jgi:beta-aspartyl-peptidase (threonine type)